MKNIKKPISTLLILTMFMTVILSGCGNQAGVTREPSVGMSSDTTEILQLSEPAQKTLNATPLDGTEPVAVTDFAVRLFRENVDDTNVLISPLSVISALGMTANGARENTLSQMEQVLGISTGKLNTYLSAYLEQLPENEKYKLSMANSIWFKDIESFTIVSDFLQANETYYHAELYKTPFDNTTLREINDWVKEETDGMITNILNEIPEEAVMYLINALAFDAEWETIYNENQVRDGVFTKEDGTTQDIELMYSTEHTYLEDQNATGFIKYYKDKRYAFAALLPNEGISVKDYAASLTGESLQEMLTTPTDVKVRAAIPKFKAEYDVEMSDILKTMGMTDAFDYTVADFSGMGSSTEGNLVINRVIHKTFIEVDEKGTQAGAATVVEMNVESAMMEPEEIKTVYLDRPFVYMLIDFENNLPIFMGTVMDLEK